MKFLRKATQEFTNANVVIPALSIIPKCVAEVSVAIGISVCISVPHCLGQFALTLSEDNNTFATQLSPISSKYSHNDWERCRSC